MAKQSAGNPQRLASHNTPAYAWLSETYNFANAEDPERFLGEGAFLHVAEATAVRMLYQTVQQPVSPDDKPFSWMLRPTFDLPIPDLRYRHDATTEQRTLWKHIPAYLDATFQGKNGLAERAQVYKHLIRLITGNYLEYNHRFLAMNKEPRFDSSQARRLIGKLAAHIFLGAMHLPANPQSVTVIPALTFQNAPWENDGFAHDAVYLEKINTKRQGSWRATKVQVKAGFGHETRYDPSVAQVIGRIDLDASVFLESGAARALLRKMPAVVATAVLMSGHHKHYGIDTQEARAAVQAMTQGLHLKVGTWRTHAGRWLAVHKEVRAAMQAEQALRARRHAAVASPRKNHRRT